MNCLAVRARFALISMLLCDSIMLHQADESENDAEFEIISGLYLMQYSTRREVLKVPRLPLEGRLDLTYRCNSACLHCWLWQSPNASKQRDELTLDEIQRIADEARALGTRRWSLSGGEPMLRPDFCEIFDYLTRKSTGYSLNTNGTLITPQIAQLLTRKGSKMIALYGATAEVYDTVTRHPGGFEKTMRGFAYLREAGAGFIVQLIPMCANRHQWNKMQELAQSLSPHWRVGASWLFLSCDRSSCRNAEIAAQRLTPGTSSNSTDPMWPMMNRRRRFG